jgi:trimeric autotransporter adhesin
MKIVMLQFIIAVLTVCFTSVQKAQATCQDGCLANDNTVLGDDALVSTTTGSGNTAIGVKALFSSTTAEGNTAIGWEALASTTTSRFNTATGWAALISNTSGSNTATGAEALLNNTTGFGNTATGGATMVLNTAGNTNTATGFAALFSNIDGNDNTATGKSALSGLTSGSNNIALGAGAGDNLNTGDNNIDIGDAGASHESNTIRIGTQGTQTITFIAGISGASITGIPIVINGNGRLGLRPSSQRFKTDIKQMDRVSEAIFALKPVTFRYNKQIDPDRTPEFGLVAEEVEKVNPNLVARDEQGKPYTVRYEAVNAMLLNEFLKEHKTVQQQGETIARLEKQVELLAAGLQKVSAQLELSTPAPQTVSER